MLTEFSERCIVWLSDPDDLAVVGDVVVADRLALDDGWAACRRCQRWTVDPTGEWTPSAARRWIVLPARRVRLIEACQGLPKNHTLHDVVNPSQTPDG